MITSALDLAKKKKNFSTVGTNKTCSHGRSGEDKYNCYVPIT